MDRPTFYEFFAGGGMARAGLGDGWRCGFANDLDPMKGRTYVANWGDREFRLGDVHALTTADLPGRADLAWASFPCQDLSLAGAGAGLAGARSGAFWGFHALMAGLRAEGRAPKLIVLENVPGLLTSNGGRDFEALCAALADLGYVFGALVIDAVHFVPQSRPRVFVVALRADLDDAPGGGGEPGGLWTTDALRRAQARLPDGLRRAWRWRRLPAAPRRNAALADLIEDEPTGVRWHTPAETARLLPLMSPLNAAKLAAARRGGARVVGTIYRRTRPDGAGKAQRAEVRLDGIAGCLRTPAGGSSRQTILVAEGDRVRTRLLSPREAARLMGLPDDYVLPTRYNDAYGVAGDGLAVPAVAHLSEHMLKPLIADHARAWLTAAE